ncbi:dehydrogenase/reductase SDR family member 7 isoform X4 [Hemiscyllium ocellatum]|uniref:dehydrogenase/reductase SDR family member 7 isoform X4 n=1 Tax=Hemiscyllium ocellatum TaxID=170820 RepID=UPI0029662DD6|nr:dehydrogenase/reductase SDR family member 7 isoform X4 [Hemiscyllium ocellatum]
MRQKVLSSTLIDILINNAGRSQRSLFLDTNLDVYEAIMHLNFLGTISLTKCVLPYMIKQEKGQIITVSSLAGLVAAPVSTGYASSKHALQGFFNSLRPELANYPGIIISTVCPGLVHSNIVKNAFTEEINKPISENSAQTCKMSTARCVQLMLVGMANELKEMWISGQPLLLYVYLWQYAPTLAWLVANKMSVKRIKNLKSGLWTGCLVSPQLFLHRPSRWLTYVRSWGWWIFGMSSPYRQGLHLLFKPT